MEATVSEAEMVGVKTERPNSKERSQGIGQQTLALCLEGTRVSTTHGRGLEPTDFILR